eukprot:gene16027-22166_t
MSRPADDDDEGLYPVARGNKKAVSFKKPPPKPQKSALAFSSGKSTKFRPSVALLFTQVPIHSDDEPKSSLPPKRAASPLQSASYAARKSPEPSTSRPMTSQSMSAKSTPFGGLGLDDSDDDDLLAGLGPPGGKKTTPGVPEHSSKSMSSAAGRRASVGVQAATNKSIDDLSKFLNDDDIMKPSAGGGGILDILGTGATASSAASGTAPRAGRRAGGSVGASFSPASSIAVKKTTDYSAFSDSPFDAPSKSTLAPAHRMTASGSTGREDMTGGGKMERSFSDNDIDLAGLEPTPSTRRATATFLAFATASVTATFHCLCLANFLAFATATASAANSVTGTFHCLFASASATSKTDNDVFGARTGRQGGGDPPLKTNASGGNPLGAASSRNPPPPSKKDAVNFDSDSFDLDGGLPGMDPEPKKSSPPPASSYEPSHSKPREIPTPKSTAYDPLFAIGADSFDDLDLPDESTATKPMAPATHTGLGAGADSFDDLDLPDKSTAARPMATATHTGLEAGADSFDDLDLPDESTAARPMATATHTGLEAGADSFDDLDLPDESTAARPMATATHTGLGAGMESTAGSGSWGGSAAGSKVGSALPSRNTTPERSRMGGLVTAPSKSSEPLAWLVLVQPCNSATSKTLILSAFQIFIALQLMKRNQLCTIVHALRLPIVLTTLHVLCIPGLLPGLSDSDSDGGDNQPSFSKTTATTGAAAPGLLPGLSDSDSDGGDYQPSFSKPTATTGAAAPGAPRQRRNFNDPGLLPGLSDSDSDGGDYQPSFSKPTATTGAAAPGAPRQRRNINDPGGGGKEKGSSGGCRRGTYTSVISSSPFQAAVEKRKAAAAAAAGGPTPASSAAAPFRMPGSRSVTPPKANPTSSAVQSSTAPKYASTLFDSSAEDDDLVAPIPQRAGVSARAGGTASSASAAPATFSMPGSRPITAPTPIKMPGSRPQTPPLASPLRSPSPEQGAMSIKAQQEAAQAMAYQMREQKEDEARKKAAVAAEAARVRRDQAAKKKEEEDRVAAEREAEMQSQAMAAEFLREMAAEQGLTSPTGSYPLTSPTGSYRVASPTGGYPPGVTPGAASPRGGLPPGVTGGTQRASFKEGQIPGVTTTRSADLQPGKGGVNSTRSQSPSMPAGHGAAQRGIPGVVASPAKGPHAHMLPQVPTLMCCPRSPRSCVALGPHAHDAHRAADEADRLRVLVADLEAELRGRDARLSEEQSKHMITLAESQAMSVRESSKLHGEIEDGLAAAARMRRQADESAETHRKDMERLKQELDSSRRSYAEEASRMKEEAVRGVANNAIEREDRALRAMERDVIDREARVMSREKLIADRELKIAARERELDSLRSDLQTLIMSLESNTSHEKEDIKREQMRLHKESSRIEAMQGSLLADREDLRMQLATDPHMLEGARECDAMLIIYRQHHTLRHLLFSPGGDLRMQLATDPHMLEGARECDGGPADVAGHGTPHARDRDAEDLRMQLATERRMLEDAREARRKERESYMNEVVAERKSVSEENAAMSHKLDTHRADLLGLKTRLQEYESRAATAKEHATREEARLEKAQKEYAIELGAISIAREKLESDRKSMETEAKDLVAYAATLAEQSAELAARHHDVMALREDLERRSGELAVELMRAQGQGIQLDEQQRNQEEARKKLAVELMRAQGQGIQLDEQQRNQEESRKLGGGFIRRLGHLFRMGELAVKLMRAQGHGIQLDEQQRKQEEAWKAFERERLHIAEERRGLSEEKVQASRVSAAARESQAKLAESVKAYVMQGIPIPFAVDPSLGGGSVTLSPTKGGMVPFTGAGMGMGMPPAAVNHRSVGSAGGNVALQSRIGGQARTASRNRLKHMLDKLGMDFGDMPSKSSGASAYISSQKRFLNDLLLSEVLPQHSDSWQPMVDSSNQHYSVLTANADPFSLSQPPFTSYMVGDGVGGLGKARGAPGLVVLEESPAGNAANHGANSNRRHHSTQPSPNEGAPPSGGHNSQQAGFGAGRNSANGRVEGAQVEMVNADKHNGSYPEKRSWAFGVMCCGLERSKRSVIQAQKGTLSTERNNRVEGRQT